MTALDELRDTVALDILSAPDGMGLSANQAYAVANRLMTGKAFALALQRVAELEAALRFYAAPQNYEMGADTAYGNGPGGQVIQPERVFLDGGRIARTALGEEADREDR